MSLARERNTSDIHRSFNKLLMWSRILSCQSCLSCHKEILKARSIDKISELILSRNKSEKDVAKKVSITIMRIPRWHWLPINKFGSAACCMIVWRLTSSHIFLAIAQATFKRNATQVGIGAWHVRCYARQSRRSPPWDPSPKNNPQL